MSTSSRSEVPRPYDHDYDDDRDRRVALRADLARLALAKQPLSAALQRIAAITHDLADGADDASVALLVPHREPQTAFSGSHAMPLDERVVTSVRGPALQAARTGSNVRIDETARDRHHADFSRLALRHGVHGVLSVAVRADPGARASLTVYGPGPFDAADTARLEHFAIYAGVTIGNAVGLAAAVGLAHDLEQAERTRAVIEQAKGVLMVHLHCGPDEAYDHLLRMSMRANRKLRDVAQALVTAGAAPQGDGARGPH